MADRAMIKRIQRSGDLQGLMEMLRYPPDAELRAAAAQVLGELLDFDAVENLIRSTLLDPDPAVQKAARLALEHILGNRAQSAIDLYPVDPAEKESWLHPVAVSSPLDSEDDDEDEDDENDEEDDEDDEEDDELEEDTQNEDEDEDEDEEEEQSSQVYSKEEDLVTTAERGGWLGRDLSALVTILRTEGSVHLRVRAARALANIGKVDMKAVEALAETALWSDSPSVRRAANKSLVKLFGDKEAHELLHTYRAASGSTEWGDDFYKDDVREDLDEAENAEEEENVDLEEVVSEPAAGSNPQAPAGDLLTPPKPLPYTGHPPVVQDEGGGKVVLVLLVVVIVLVLAGLAYYYFGIFK